MEKYGHGEATAMDNLEYQIRQINKNQQKQKYEKVFILDMFFQG